MMSRHWTAIAMTTWLARAGHRHRSGRKAGAIAIHNVNGKKMRSTSALLIPVRVASTTVPSAAAMSTATGSRRRSAVAAPGSPAQTARPALIVRVAKLPHAQ